MNETNVNNWGDAVMNSTTGALAMFFAAIPKIIAFALILVIGWFVASLIAKGVGALLRAVHFNDLARKSGFADFVAKMGVNTDASGLLGEVAKWFVRLIAMVVAFDALGLPAVSDVLRQLLLWLPNLVVALVVLVIGGLAATALSNLVRAATAEAGFRSPNMLAKVASVAVWGFAIVVAVNQLGIAETLVNTLFMGFIGAMALAAGLAFGLGGRETAAEIVKEWRRTTQEKAGQVQQAGERAGEIAREQGAGLARGQGGAGRTGGQPGYGAAGATGAYRQSDPYSPGAPMDPNRPSGGRR